MPVLRDFALPASPKVLRFPSQSSNSFFLCFISSVDPATKQSWCPDVRAALPRIDDVFAGDDGPEVALVEVGQRPEWRELGNRFRTQWNVNNVPALVRYERAGGEVKETGRLIEEQLLDKKKLRGLVEGSS